MYVVNGIAYAGTAAQDMRVAAVKMLSDMMMLVTFASAIALFTDSLNSPLSEARTWRTSFPAGAGTQ